MTHAWIYGGGLVLFLAGGAARAEMPIAADAHLRAALIGNSMVGTMVETGPMAEFYAPDGTILGPDYSGQWRIEDDRMCFRYGAAAEECWQAQIDGATVLWLKDGQVLGEGSIQPGNRVRP